MAWRRPEGADAAARHALESALKQTRCADINCFSPHAAIRCSPDELQAIEKLNRHFIRPALTNKQVQTNAAGQVFLRLKTSWRDGTMRLLMSPLESCDV